VLYLFIFLQTLLLSNSKAESAVFLRYDPGFYYDRIKAHPEEKTTDLYIKELVSYWKLNHIRGVYLLLHSPEYGAFYPTKIKHELIEPNLGKTTFIKKLLKAGKKEKITFEAFFYFLRSKTLWNTNPGWRAANCNQENEFLLDVRNPEVRKTYENLIDDTMKKFPLLSGIDLSEPISVNHCENTDHQTTMELTRFITRISKKIHALRKEISITPNLPVNENGNLWSESETKSFFGFSLLQVLKESNIDLILPQLDFYQWQKAFPIKRAQFDLHWSLKNFSIFLKRIPKKYHQKVGIHLEVFAMNSKDVQAIRKKKFPRLDYYETELARGKDIKFYAH